MVAAHYIKRAPKLLADKAHAGPVPVISGSTEIRQPKGVVGIIAPWNFPFATSISDAIPALIAGNGVVMKPDNKTALSGLYGIELLEKAGLPAGLMQVVCGEGPDIGPTLIDNANYVMFTGSTATGRVVGERAGRNLIGCCLELGGKNPMIVLPDANLDDVVQGLAVRRLRQHRPDLHAHRADVHPRFAVRRLPRALRRGDRGHGDRGDLRLHARAGLAGVGRPPGAGALPRRRRGRQGRDGAHRWARAARHRAGVLRADDPRGRHRRHADRDVRDVRPGRRAAPLLRPRRRDPARQRHRLRPQRVRLGDRPGRGDRGGAPDRGRAT